MASRRKKTKVVRRRKEAKALKNRQKEIRRKATRATTKAK